MEVQAGDTPHPRGSPRVTYAVVRVRACCDFVRRYADERRRRNMDIRVADTLYLPPAGGTAGRRV